jgi:uncharacterized protein (TIGR03000 family)
MYSVVLAMALVGGAEAPDCHWGNRGGCWGGGYGGCHGGGGWYGGGCSGYGGGGVYRAAGWYGGGTYYAGDGYYGQPGFSGGPAHYGGTGQYSAPGNSSGTGTTGRSDNRGTGATGTQGSTSERVGEPTKSERVGEPTKANQSKEEGSLSSRAWIVVNLPADAKLTVDGDFVSQQTGNQRLLQTPPIEPGRQFTYTLAAEVMRNGQPVRQQQQVTLQPGQQLAVNFVFTAEP